MPGTPVGSPAWHARGKDRRATVPGVGASKADPMPSRRALPADGASGALKKRRRRDMDAKEVRRCIALPREDLRAHAQVIAGQKERVPQAGAAERNRDTLKRNLVVPCGAPSQAHVQG
jgi:hypothetical protein